MTARERADRLLVARGFYESRARAQAAITAGLVTADGVPIRKASDAISTTAEIEAKPAHPYVSRGGLKLAAALDHFQSRCDRPRLSRRRRFDRRLFRGTGGTRRTTHLCRRRRDRPASPARCRAQRGRIDGHLYRTLDPARLAEPPDFAVVDVSFISLKLVLPAIGNLLRARTTIIALIKPQFEAARAAIKKGIVRDPAVHAAVCDDIAAFFAAEGWRVGRVIPSPIPAATATANF